MLLACTTKPATTLTGLRLQDVATGKFTSLDRFANRPAIVVFWETSCIPCRRELPQLGAVYPWIRNQGVEVLGVSFDRSPISTVDLFARRYRLEFPTFADPGRQTAERFAIFGVPTAILLDGRGRKSELFGEVDWSDPLVRGQVAQLAARVNQ
ncbi:MAG: TlpA disulfide reductase family protein [Gemmatimonadaceae bacterium]